MLQVEHSAILSTFIKLPIVIKIFVLSIFEWPFYTGFTVGLYFHMLYVFYSSKKTLCIYYTCIITEESYQLLVAGFIPINTRQQRTSLTFKPSVYIARPPDKSSYWKTIFLISQPKHMLWVLKRTISMRRFF